MLCSKVWRGFGVFFGFCLLGFGMLFFGGKDLLRDSGLEPPDVGDGFISNKMSPNRFTQNHQVPWAAAEDFAWLLEFL